MAQFTVPKRLPFRTSETSSRFYSETIPFRKNNRIEWCITFLNSMVSEVRNDYETVGVLAFLGKKMIFTFNIYLRAFAAAMSASEELLIMCRSHCLYVRPLASSSFRMTD